MRLLTDSEETGLLDLLVPGFGRLRGTEADREFAKWVHSGGKVLPGLVTRRAAERKMFLQGGAADIAALLLGVMMAGSAVLVAMLFVL